MSGRPAPIPFGRYLLYDRLATGGMAELFYAKATGEAGFEKACVIKRVLPHLSANERFVKMFLDEARLAARLDHPGVVHIFDLGRQGEHYYIAMEYLAGEDCAELIHASRERGKPVPWKVACAIATSSAEALHYAHDARGDDGKPLGLVHRDVTPSNLFVTYQGAVKLLDFGIALSAHRLQQTATGQVKGKAGYMAPEQAQGLGVDRRADVWSLGVCLYELLIGAPLFEGATNVESALKVLRGKVAPPSTQRPDVPPALDEVVMRALTLDPRDRWSDARTFADALRPFLPDSPHTALADYLVGVFGAEKANDKVEKAKTGEGHAWPRPGTLPLGAVHGGEEPVRTTTLPAGLDATTDPDAQRVRRRKLIPAVGAAIAAALALVAAGVVFVTRGDPKPEAPRPPSPTPQGTAVFSASVSSEPPDAALYLDGERLGERTPTTLSRLPAGSYEVRLTKDGFKSQRVRFEVGPGKTPPALKLQLQRDEDAVAFGMLDVKTNPAGAVLFLDGRRVADSSPALLAEVLADDEHVLVAEREGFDVATTRVAVAAGAVKSVALTLTRPKLTRQGERKKVPVRAEPRAAMGRLSVESNLAVTVWLDGSKLGAVPLSTEVPAGRHVLKLESTEAGVSRAARVEVKSGQTTSYSGEFRRAKLNVRVRPWADVYLDGKRLGQTPLAGREVWEGRHALRLVGPSDERTLSIDAVAGETVIVNEVLADAK